MGTTIKTYRENTARIKCSVSGISDLTGYTSTLTVKSKISGTTKFSITGSISNTTIEFKATPSNNDISAGEYVYDITISDNTDNYTVVQGKYIIIESVRYS